MNKGIITTLDYNIKTIENLFSNKEYFQSEIDKYSNTIAEQEERGLFLKDCKTLYTQAVDYLYKESIGTLEDTLNTALQYIIFDKDYSVKLELEDGRVGKALNISLVDNKEGFTVDLFDSVGNGIRTIISFVLKVYYLLNEGSKILFLDEKYSALSAQYVPLFFEFMKRMTEEKDFIIVMVTHDERFMDYADRTYRINDGVVVLEEENDKEENAS